MMEWETRIAFIDPYARVIFVQTNTLVVQFICFCRLILLHQVPALEISTVVHPKQGND